MIVRNYISLRSIIRVTWKTTLLELVICTGAYFAHVYVINDVTDIPAILPTLLGTALAFFIGFNNNQAYDRWWEARKIWGALVNDSRSWARSVNHYINKPATSHTDDLPGIRKRMIKRHLSFLYAMKAYLRQLNDDFYKKYLSEEEVRQVSGYSNIHSAILDNQSRDLNELYEKKYFDGFSFIQLNELIVRFSDEMGKSERIRNTVFPTMYNYFTRLFIWFLVVSVTLFTVDYVGEWSILIGLLVGYVFHTTHTIGLALLNPFKMIFTGIPLDQITRTIEINLLESINENEIPSPVEPIGDSVM